MCKTAGKHFNQLMTRYGSPAIVLNLVKKRERKRKHEGLITFLKNAQKNIREIKQFHEFFG